jgi:hypothetical protein
MPNRILKESFNESAGLASTPPFAQDLFRRLITYADDYGRFNSDLEILRARLYPKEIDSVLVDDIEEGLIELCGVSKVRFYRATADNGPSKLYGYLVGWAKHQRLRNSKAKCPEPEEEWNDWALQRCVPIALRVAIFDRDRFKCQECGKSFQLRNTPTKRALRLLGGVLHIDHIVPVRQGGRATLENLRLLCDPCNLTRSRKLTPEEFQYQATTGRDAPRVAAASRKLRPESELELESESNPNPIQLAPKSTRQPNPIFDALCEACGMDPAEVSANRSESAKVGVAASKLTKLNPDRAEILRRASAWPAVMGDATMTPHAIANNWARLAGKARSNGKRDQALEVASGRWRKDLA